MKIVTLMVILLVALASCDSKPSDDKSGENFIYSSQSVTALGLLDTSYSIGAYTCTSALPTTHCKAIIYSGTINNTSYTGIAVTDNADPVSSYAASKQNYNHLIKVYFQGPISSGTYNVTTVFQDTTRIRNVRDCSNAAQNCSVGLSIDCSTLGDGRCTITNTSDININGTVYGVGGFTVTAVKVGE